MRWHIVEGEAGCAFAREHGFVAVIVDALRASATAAMLLHHGAVSILAVREVEEALAAKTRHPDALLFGERGGLPPEGFDYGNSPLETGAAKGREVIFTTTTGAGRLVSAWGAKAVYLGTTVNATAVADRATSHGIDVVLIPAGLTGDPNFDAQEDRVAAVAIALTHGGMIGEGQAFHDAWAPRIQAEGTQALFHTAPHAAKLRKVGKEVDIEYCARMDLTTAVPCGVAREDAGVRVMRA